MEPELGLHYLPINAGIIKESSPYMQFAILPKDPPPVVIYEEEFFDPGITTCEHQTKTVLGTIVVKDMKNRPISREYFSWEIVVCDHVDPPKVFTSEVRSRGVEMIY